MTLVVNRQPVIKAGAVGAQILGYTVPAATTATLKLSVSNTTGGVQSRCGYVFGTCVDLNGNAYYADSTHMVIRKVSPAGQVTTLAGSGATGTTDGTGAGASFSSPYGICVDSAGTNLYVVDGGGNKLRKIVIATGVVTTVAGSGSAASTDGTGAGAAFNGPRGICIDSTNTNLFITDFGGCKIRKVVISSGVVTTIAGTGTVSSTDNTTGTSATFNSPAGICIDSTNTNIYVTEYSGHKIRKITNSGVYPTATVAGSGAANVGDGFGVNAFFNSPSGVAITKDDAELYITDTVNSLIRRYTFSTTYVATVAGIQGLTTVTEGYGVLATLRNPISICIDPAGNTLIGVSNTYQILKFDTSNGFVSFFVGNAAYGNHQGQAQANVTTYVNCWVAATAALCSPSNQIMAAVPVASGEVVSFSPGNLNAGDKLWFQGSNHGATVMISAMERS